MLKLENIAKSFTPIGDRVAPVEILSNLNLRVTKGETAAILGKSGSGKSTLLSLIAGLDTPTSGSLTINGTDITALAEKELTQFRSKNISIVFQQYHLIQHLSAIENVLLPLQLTGKISTQDPIALLQAVGLADRSNHYPSQLSGGEQQRVAIARALVVEPALLLADEPTGNLDDETSEEVTKYLFDTVSSLGLTMVMVTHDKNLADFCEKQYFLQRGELSLTETFAKKKTSTI